jgi:uncharacterized protein YgbK (DUF1537 family)
MQRGRTAVDPQEPVGQDELLAPYPPPRRIPGALELIRKHVTERNERIAVLDDDPTGTQSIHDVAVVTAWEDDDLAWALEQPDPTFYVLTNSRSRPPDEAAAMNEEIASGLARAATRVNARLAVTSRSDSTMRGHFPLETDVLRRTLEAAGRHVDGVVLCPAFIEAGRLTVDDVQWVRDGDQLVPMGQTAFAADHTFGYSHSNLALWVEEKTDGRVPAGEVLSIGLDLLRGDEGLERVAARLGESRDGRPVVVNAADVADLEIFVLGLLRAEDAGRSFIYRTGPSFPRVRGGIESVPPVSLERLHPHGVPAGRHGVVLVGSYVPMSSRQLEAALRLPDVHPVELSVPRLIDPAARGQELDRAVEEVNRSLLEAEVVVYTSRELITSAPGSTPLEIGGLVSDALVEVVARLDASRPPAFVVAKGGITSSDIATRGLRARRAHVAGQMLPGIVPVWNLGEDSAFPGIPYVVFPGNVGGPDSLAEVIDILRGRGGPR